jgi:hypothetical protein
MRPRWGPIGRISFNSEEQTVLENAELGNWFGVLSFGMLGRGMGVGEGVKCFLGR